MLRVLSWVSKVTEVLVHPLCLCLDEVVSLSLPFKPLRKLLSREVVGHIQVFGLAPRHCAVIMVPNMMCLTSYALALVLVACVKVRKAK